MATEHQPGTEPNANRPAAVTVQFAVEGGRVLVVFRAPGASISVVLYRRTLAALAAVARAAAADEELDELETVVRCVDVSVSKGAQTHG